MIFIQLKRLLALILLIIAIIIILDKKSFTAVDEFEGAGVGSYDIETLESYIARG